MIAIANATLALLAVLALGVALVCTMREDR